MRQRAKGEDMPGHREGAPGQERKNGEAQTTPTVEVTADQAGDISVHATGLTPGTPYAFQCNFQADDGSGGQNLGSNARNVRDDGTITNSAPADMANPDGKDGGGEAWLSPVDANGNSTQEVANVNGVDLKGGYRLP